MIRLRDDISVARELVAWLHSNVRVCSKPDMAPSYGSFLNDTVQWKSVDHSWMVTCKPKKGIIDLELNVDRDTEALIKLKWS